MAELMKGNVWKDRRDAKDRKGNPIVTYPVYVEDKHDEIRCHVQVTDIDPQCPMAYKVEFLSYSGKPLANMQRFHEPFVRLFEATGYREFDLGFEVNGNFNDSYRWVRSTKKLPDDLLEAAVKFYIFGLPEATSDMLGQLKARYILEVMAPNHTSIPFVVPHCIHCYNVAGVEAAFNAARERGREGVMVKQMHAKYERKRTDGWLKMKPEDDADGVIVALHDAISLEGVPLGRTGSVTIKCEDDSEASPHGIPHDLGRDMHNNPEKYIGQWAEFKYMERDRQGGYRHPTFYRLREEKK